MRSIGSGDTTTLLSGIQTKGYRELLTRFVSGDKPYYNALASPIDALRTGAILEGRYLLILPDGYYSQVVVFCKEMDVLRSSIDFARIDGGQVVDFDELKTCNYIDFLEIEGAIKDADGGLAFIKKRYKANYNQIQQQLLCTGLTEANLVFMVVYSYDDEVNMTRIINDNEVVKFRISRDEEVIHRIKARASIFQTIKNHFKK